MSTARFVAAALFVTALPGQTAARTATEPPHVLLETVGPAGFRTRLGPTNLGNLLASERGREVWEPYAEKLASQWRRLIGDEAAYVAAHDRLIGYSGTIRLGVWLMADKPNDEPVLAAALVLEGDGRTDLNALAADLRSWQEQLPGEWKQQVVQGKPMQLRASGDDRMTAQEVADKFLLIVGAEHEHVEAALQRGRDFAAASTGMPPPPASPALRLAFDLPAIVALRRQAGRDDERAAMSALGIESLGRLQFSIATAGPRVMIELDQAFVSDQRGIFGALCPSSPGVSGLLHLGTGESTFKVGRFDWTALHDSVLEALQAGREVEAAKARADMKEAIGIDLRDDLLQHATDEVFVQLSPFADLDRLRDATWVFGVRLRDQAAFAKGLDAMLAKTRPLLSREREEDDDGVRLQRYGNMLNYDLWVGVGHGLFIVGAGSTAEDRLKELFKAGKGAATALAAAAKAPPAFSDLERFLPAGTNGLARGDIDAVLGLPTEWWLDLALEATLGASPGRAYTEQTEAARELLRQHNLATLRTATGYAERRWRWRLFW